MTQYDYSVEAFLEFEAYTARVSLTQAEPPTRPQVLEAARTAFLEQGITFPKTQRFYIYKVVPIG